MPNPSLDYILENFRRDLHEGSPVSVCLECERKSRQNPQDPILKEAKYVQPGQIFWHWGKYEPEKIARYQEIREQEREAARKKAMGQLEAFNS